MRKILPLLIVWMIFSTGIAAAAPAYGTKMPQKKEAFWGLEHYEINRRNLDVLSLLVALANGELEMSANSPASRTAEAASPVASERIRAWLQALDEAGLRRPDATEVAVNRGAATAAGQYKAARSLVFLHQIDEDTLATLADKGWRALDFSDPAQWSARFASHPDVFGKTESNQ